MQNTLKANQSLAFFLSELCHRNFCPFRDNSRDIFLCHLRFVAGFPRHPLPVVKQFPGTGTVLSAEPLSLGQLSVPDSKCHGCVAVIHLLLKFRCLIILLVVVEPHICAGFIYHIYSFIRQVPVIDITSGQRYR